MRRVIVGTAGHIDHGKTSLVKVLTGIDTDRLKEEKRRGITIDIGFANLELPSGVLIGIVDVPGHERFIKNMVAGASGIDLVMLVIAADEGVMPQTREHLEICELLGIKDGLVVLTKVDLVDEEWLELVKADVEEFLKGTFLEKAPILTFSAKTGEGKEELLKVLEEKASVVLTKPLDEPFRLPIDGVFTIKGFGTVVRGTAISGRVRVGDVLCLYPAQKITKVRKIQVHGKDVEESIAGTRTALNLQGVEKDEVERGDVLAERGVLKPSQWVDVSLKLLKSCKPNLKNFENLLFYIGTSEVPAKVILMGKEGLSAGEEDVAQIQLQRPVCVWRGDRFILRRPSNNTTIGGGVVLLPVSSKRKRTKPWERKELEFLKTATPQELLMHYLKKRGILGAERAELQIQLSIFKEKFNSLIESMGEKVISLKEGEKLLYFAASVAEELEKKVVEVLEKYHRANPFSPGLTKELLKQRISSFLPECLYEHVLEKLLKKGKLQRDKEIYFLSSFRRMNKEEIEAFKREVEEKFLKEGLTPRDFETILCDFKERYKGAKELFETLLREGRLVKVSEKLVFHRQVIEELKNKVVEFLKKHKEMSISDFKGIVGKGVSRKYLIPLVEFLDKEKVTLRVGDKRILRKKL